jgi:hypothetical protein
MFCAFASGCGEKSDRIEVFPSHGKILVNGQPADGARVVFYPKVTEIDGKPAPSPAATTDAAGEYHLESYDPEDGAPAGEYSVTVVWPEPPPPNAEALGTFDLKDRLSSRFADPTKSGLTAKIEDGGGEIPTFDLK